MKKVFTIILTLSLLVVGTTAAFATDLTDEELAERHTEILVEKQEWLDELVADGVITQEEADDFITAMEDRFAEYEGEALGLGFDNENKPFQRGMNNEDGLLQRGLDNEFGFAQDGMGKGAGQARGLGQSNGFDGTCILG